MNRDGEEAIEAEEGTGRESYLSEAFPLSIARVTGSQSLDF